MLDGRSFSKLVKTKYKLPFDEKFIDMMNKTAEYLCKNIQGAKFAYVQSDEISILITDFDTPTTDAAFGYRICKLQSILASMAASKFNQLALLNEFKQYNLENGTLSIEGDKFPYDDMYGIVENGKLAEFDCKVWTVPDYNDAFCHFLWRQNDCTRNSKQQAAQTYLPHKGLLNLDADQQIAKLLDEKGIDWNAYTDGEKYGRLIYKERKLFKNYGFDAEGATGIEGYSVQVMKEQEYIRNVWTAHGATPFGEENNVIKTLIPKRNE